MELQCSNLKFKRERLGWTQQQLSEEAGISVKTLQRLEKGEIEPQAHTLNALACALEVAVSELSANEKESWSEQDRIRMNQFLSLHLLVLVIPVIYILYLIFWIRKIDEDNNCRPLFERLLSLEILITGLFFPAILMAPSFFGSVGTANSYLFAHWIIVALISARHLFIIRNALRLGKLPAALELIPRLC